MAKSHDQEAPERIGKALAPGAARRIPKPGSSR